MVCVYIYIYVCVCVCVCVFMFMLPVGGVEQINVFIIVATQQLYTMQNIHILYGFITNTYTGEKHELPLHQMCLKNAGKITKPQHMNICS